MTRVQLDPDDPAGPALELEPGGRLLPAGYSNQRSGSAHACNCIGCCPACGSCRTWSGHTADYCALLVRQRLEREELLSRS